MKKKITTTDILERAIWLLKNKGWQQGGFASTKNGVPVMTTDEDAASFCASGALIRARYDLKAPAGTPRHFDVALAVEAQLPPDSNHALVDFNDAPTRTRGDVIRLFRKTIKELKKK